MSSRRVSVGLGAVLAMFSTSAGAHPLSLPTASFAGGFLHPLSGLDHLAVMFAVGLWAMYALARRPWAAPLAFLGTMALGAALAQVGVAIPSVEAGIATSLLGMGLLLVFMVRAPAAIGASIVAVFALFHGHAHGAEMPAGLGPWSYGLGFLTATALLHALGMAAGWWSAIVTARWVRLAGAATTGVGVWLLVGA